MKMKNQLSEVKKPPVFCPHTVIRRLVLSWLAAALVLFGTLPEQARDLTGTAPLEAMSFPLLLLYTGGFFVLLTVLGSFRKTDRAEHWLITGVFAALFVCALPENDAKPFRWAGIVITALLLCYSLRGWNGSREEKPAHSQPEWWSAAAAAGFAVVFFLLLRVWTVSRYQAFMNSTYDFGIFAQAFHSLRNTLVPYTTVERDGILSHFAVHVSPIFYLMLPFYCLMPDPATLQVIQAALLASAAIPVWKLAKLHGLSGMGRVMMCLLLFLYPAYSGGVSYDFHENAALTPLILWLFYGIQRKSGWRTALFALLTLMVKEDAAVYVAVVGLWLLLRSLVRQEDRRWNLIAGAALFVGAVAWFAAVTGYLSRYGDGVMTGRYRNFMYDGSDSLVTVVKAVLMCPMKLLFECMDPEKTEYLFLSLLPMAGLPLLTRRYEHFVLLIPYVLLNLMSDYKYQHDILFQYSYGSAAFLLYLSLLNLKDLLRFRQGEPARLLLLLGLLIGATFFGEKILPEITHYTEVYKDYQESYDARAEMLETIPREASVAATTYYAPHLAQREILYDIRYCSREHLLSVEYIAVRPGDDNACFQNYATDTESGYGAFIALIQENGYILTDRIDGILEIYQKTD